MVAEANAAGLDADAGMSGRRLRNVAFLELEVRAGLGDYGDFHLGHEVFLAKWVVWFHELDARNELEVRFSALADV